MNATRFLLDCTLRDGGYVNDWEFGHDNLVYIFERVVSSGVDFIEIGFLDDRRPFDINRSIMPSDEFVNFIYGNLNRKKTKVVGMIDYGTCDISHIGPCKDSFLDGIRVIFKKENLYPAMEYCRQLKQLGYMVFSQLVSVTTYSDEELQDVISIVNEVEPFAVSLVDTYGLLNPTELTHIMKIMDDGIKPEIVLGFHAHNNFQLGYINATTALEYPTKRTILVDGTLYGMGKSAGNAPLELIAMYMNEHLGKAYNVSDMQEAIASCIMDFQKRSPWGYQLFYYIAAANKVHPNYVSYLMNKRTLSVTSINEILKKIPDDQKLEKNMALIEALYIAYQKSECDDEDTVSALSEKLAEKEIMIIGPGTTVVRERDKINHYLKDNNPLVISINYIPKDFAPDYLFLTNATRYLQSVTKLHENSSRGIKIIASSNLTKTEGKFDYIINYSDVIDESAEFPDNSMCMLIRLLIRCGCKKVSLAGLDGYTADSVNYFDTDKEYSFLKEKAETLNNYAREFLHSIEDQLNIAFVTSSEYNR